MDSLGVLNQIIPELRGTKASIRGRKRNYIQDSEAADESGMRASSGGWANDRATASFSAICDVTTNPRTYASQCSMIIDRSRLGEISFGLCLKLIVDLINLKS